MAKKPAATARAATAGSAYRAAGVDQDGKDKIVENILHMARRTHGPRVIDVPWGFAGFFALQHDAPLFKRPYRKPVLCGCADGVGTKLKIAFMTDRHDTVGIDLVAMNVNDLIVHGGDPLFFLDYVAMSKVKKQTVVDLVKGIVQGCREADCALLGGETAEMPGFYAPGEYELAGFCTGVVDRDRMILGKKIVPGDVVIGLRSSGLHSNGFSLVRKVLFEKARLRPHTHVSELGMPLADELLKPTRIYVPAIRALLDATRNRTVVKGMANITGGGIVENLPRVLPPDTGADIDARTWDPQPIFHLIRRHGRVSSADMFRTFNMGIGYMIVTGPRAADATIARLRAQGYPGLVVGQIRRGQQDVRIVNA